jgi:hypothetical protein
MIPQSHMPGLAAAVCAALVLAGPAASAAPPDPMALYGDAMVFSVWRSGSEIGQHRVTFARDNGALVVQSFLDLAVKLLGITVYRYHYHSQEIWRDGRLAELASAIDDNGTKTAVAAKETQGTLTVTGPAGSTTVAGAILPSTHWNPQTITADRVLNTLNGKIDSIHLVPQGIETVPTGAGPRAAMHYLWTGEIKAESWYDTEGHWLKLRFPGTDGTPIDYVCVRCLAASP